MTQQQYVLEFPLYLKIIFIAIIIISWIVLGFLTKDIYKKKGYDEIAGFLIGLFLGITGMLYAIGLPLKKDCVIYYRSTYQSVEQDDGSKQRKTNSNSQDTEQDDSFEYCKNCGFPIYNDEDKCQNCGMPKE